MYHDQSQKTEVLTYGLGFSIASARLTTNMLMAPAQLRNLYKFLFLGRSLSFFFYDIDKIELYVVKKKREQNHSGDGQQKNGINGTYRLG